MPGNTIGNCLGNFLVLYHGESCDQGSEKIANSTTEQDTIGGESILQDEEIEVAIGKVGLSCWTISDTVRMPAILS